MCRSSDGTVFFSNVDFVRHKNTLSISFSDSEVHRLSIRPISTNCVHFSGYSNLERDRMWHPISIGISQNCPTFLWLPHTLLHVSTSQFLIIIICESRAAVFDTNQGNLKSVQLTCGAYSISQEICTRFCCALLCCGYAIVHNEFTWSIYPYSSGLLCWHWGNR